MHLDTHVALWLAAGETRRLRPVQARLRRSALYVSPIVIVEMEVLREIGRIREAVADVLEILTEDHGVREAVGDITSVGQHARSLGWTRDPFDRLIVAHALASRATLLTADDTIREHCRQARWDD
ncbi:MAG: PIN domain-containing protein [Deltaproteobacteria bacterium]|nr:PIN domain-containing protein [Deltaproteobacteria bacterium]